MFGNSNQVTNNNSLFNKTFAVMSGDIFLGCCIFALADFPGIAENNDLRLGA